MKVYIATRETGEPCVAETETYILGVFSTEEKARKCIEEKSKQLVGERFYRDIGSEISASVNRGIEVAYRYGEYELDEVLK